tara:strand:+ start:942 stop:2933 length:1992 start_codon:yes stop_codon:yes gene_type:complete
MKKVLLVGPILTQSGYGVHARTVYRALKSRPDLFDLYVMPIGWGQTSWQFEDSEERREIDSAVSKAANYLQQKGTFDLCVMVTIPSEWEQYRNAPVNIGVCAGIEADKVSGHWLAAANQFVDRIIVTADFAKKGFIDAVYNAQNPQGQVFELKIETPIHPVNYPINSLVTESKNKLTIDFKHDFNFLCVSQWGPRKNFEGTLKMFLEEFHDDEVGLVIKAHLAGNSIIDRHETEKRLREVLRNYPDRVCSVKLIHGYLTDEEMGSLIKSPKIKAMINFGHGEGFGLPLYEAACCGVPVITHDWGGQRDFLYAPKKDKKTKKEKMRAFFSKVVYEVRPIQKEAVWPGVLEPEAKWAFVNEQSAKIAMREVCENYSLAQNKARTLKKYIYESGKFSEETIYHKFCENILGEEIKPPVKIEDLPTISIITSVYDGDDYIEPFLEDITRQTIFEEKCELLLINANSPGNEENIINKYVEKYPDNIKYVKLDDDPGIYGVWNMGVEMASGEYLTNANLDDRKATNSLEEHAKALYQADDIDLVYADMLITQKPNETFENNSCNNAKYNFPEFSFDNLKMVNMPHASPMWRKTIHDKYGKFEDKYRSAGDWEMWLRAASKGSKFKKMQQPLGLYYFNPKGISTNPENFDWKRKEEAEIYEKYKDVTAAG